jgi:hypothetical protein
LKPIKAGAVQSQLNSRILAGGTESAHRNKYTSRRLHLMRMIMHVIMPHELFNAAVRDGSVGQKMQRILADQKPEVAYFAEYNGHRSGFLIVNVSDASQIPALAEPWFLTFNADVHISPAMSPEDLGKAGLDAIGKKWA